MPRKSGPGRASILLNGVGLACLPDEFCCGKIGHEVLEPEALADDAGWAPTHTL